MMSPGERRTIAVRLPITVTVGIVTRSAAALRWPMTVTVGSVAAAVGVCFVPTRSEPNAIALPAIRLNVRTAEKRFSEVMIGSFCLGTSGDALGRNVESRFAASQRLATKRGFRPTRRDPGRRTIASGGPLGP